MLVDGLLAVAACCVLLAVGGFVFGGRDMADLTVQSGEAREMHIRAR
ncbi:hypothetical protein AB0D12_33150 [Streptomyces sp. NPDC048479]